MFAWDALKVISDVNVPLLVLYATHGAFLPAEQSTRLFDAAQCEKEIRAIDTGHVPNLENPELLTPILAECSTRHSAGEPSS